MANFFSYVSAFKKIEAHMFYCYPEFEEAELYSTVDKHLFSTTAQHAHTFFEEIGIPVAFYDDKWRELAIVEAIIGTSKFRVFIL